MASNQLYKYDSVTGENGILYLMRHHKRSTNEVFDKNPHIDRTRTSLNYSLLDDRSPDDIAMHAKVQILKAGVTPRKNCVMAVEIVFSLPVNRHNQNTRPFFVDCFNWVKQTYPCELLSFDVHLDEASPHAHCLVLPLLEGKMQGDKIKGDRTHAKQLQEKFHNEVARHHGLSKSVRKRFTHAEKKCLSTQVLYKLKNDPVTQSSIWPCVRDSISKDPLPFAQLLSIQEASVKRKMKQRTFVEIMTSKGKGHQSESQNPIGI